MTHIKTRRVLTISTLWPNATNRRFGTFVARSVEALNRETHWKPVVINPIGIPPIPFGHYRQLRDAAVDGVEEGLEVYRPIFRLIPKVGGRLNPAMIARKVVPLADDMAALGMDRSKIGIHYTGLDRDRFRPLNNEAIRPQLSERLGIPIAHGDELLATVGALIARKGQSFVIKALNGLPRARLLLVGKGEDEASLRALARSEGVADRVHFLGNLDHDLLPVVLSAADAMVLPSASEGLANAWIEALACGTPIVITDAGGAREVVTSPAAGIITARRADAVRQGIRLVLDQRYLAEEVAATVERFSWAANGRTLGEWYDRLLGGRTD